MPKVLCTLLNASEDIGGIKFAPHANGMLSEEISDDQAHRLASIPGYQLVGAAAPSANTDLAAAAAADKAKADERSELVTKAEALGVKVKGNWSNDRLKSEIEAADKAKDDPVASAEGESE